MSLPVRTPSLRCGDPTSQLPQGIEPVHGLWVWRQSTVGAGLSAMRPAQAKSRLGGRPPSLASQLLQGARVVINAVNNAEPCGSERAPGGVPTMVVNDDAGNLDARGALGFFASRLAPTGNWRKAAGVEPAHLPFTGASRPFMHDRGCPMIFVSYSFWCSFND
jgi:hypothetical protein